MYDIRSVNTKEKKNAVKRYLKTESKARYTMTHRYYINKIYNNNELQYRENTINNKTNTRTKY